MKKVVITISREYGSGGREVARLLAEKLDIPYYDKEILVYMSKESKLDPDLFDKIECKEEFDNFYFNGSLEIGKGFGTMKELTLVELHRRLQNIQEKLIRKLAKESCVIVGRCADYILKDDPDVVSVFIRAGMGAKKDRCINIYGEDEEDIIERIKEVDSKRAAYYSHFTNGSWGRPSNYDLVLSTTHLSLENAANVISYFTTQRDL